MSQKSQIFCTTEYFWGNVPGDDEETIFYGRTTTDNYYANRKTPVQNQQ